MKRIVELCYWNPMPDSKGGKYGHVGILFKAKHAKDNIYASYVLPPTIRHKCSCIKREYLLFHISTTLSVDEDDTMRGRKPNKTILVDDMDVSKMLLWLKGFMRAHQNRKTIRRCCRARYMKINIGLLCARFWRVNCSDSLADDHEVCHILTSGHSNCSTFAYALLRVGGIQKPDGIPRRHFIFSVFCALCGVAQVVPIFLFGHEKMTLSYNGSTEVVYPSVNFELFKAESFILCCIPVLTIAAVVISTSINLHRKIIGIRTPEFIYHLVKHHNNKKTINRVRQAFGPNNKVSGVLYALLILGVLADTVLLYGGVYTENNIIYSLMGDLFLLAVFVSALTVDSLFETRCDKMVRRRNRNKFHVASTVGLFKDPDEEAKPIYIELTNMGKGTMSNDPDQEGKTDADKLKAGYTQVLIDCL